MGIAISRLGLSAREFYQLSQPEFFEALLDQQEREKLLLELPIRAMWETARYQVYCDMATNVNLKSKPKRVTDVMGFPWETESRRDAPEQTVEQQKTALMNLFVAFGKGRGK